MTMTVNREALLRRLQEVEPGLSSREIIEQSSCFVFRNGRVMTFNEEIACKVKSGLPEDFTGAVQSAALLNTLPLMTEDEITLSVKNGELIIEGSKKSRTGIKMDAKVMLPMSDVEKPGEWRALPKGFTEAVEIVQECSGKDQNHFALTCIHMHPDYLEACDNIQLIRYKLKTGVKKPILVRRDALTYVPKFELTKVSETASWIHFKGPSGLILSCRRFSEEFPDISTNLKVEGAVPITIPKTLAPVIEIAKWFSKENEDNDHLEVKLEPGLMHVRGEGVSGWHGKPVKCKYKGPSIAFRIGPKMLLTIIEKFNDCQITDKRLKVTGERFTYVSCLHQNKKTEKKKSEDN